MRLFITIEAQNAVEIGIADILHEIENELSFVTDGSKSLEDINNYGTEFRVISVIPSCVNDAFWRALGWKERTKIWRKKKEADIRLRMDYDQFIRETPTNKRLMFIRTIVESIQLLQKNAEGDFQGDALISDILNTLKVQESQLQV